MEYRINITSDPANNRMVIDVKYPNFDKVFYIGNISEDAISEDMLPEILGEFDIACENNGITIFDILTDYIATTLTNRINQIVATVAYHDEIEGLAVDDNDDDTTDGY